MKAGLLREILEFREEVKSQDRNGFVSNRYETVLTCKASRRKMSAVADKSGVNAMEQFIGSIIGFGIIRRLKKTRGLFIGEWNMR